MVRVGTIRIYKVPNILWAAAAALTPVAPRHIGPEFGSEYPLHLPVCGAARVEKRHEMLGSVSSVHV